MLTRANPCVLVLQRCPAFNTAVLPRVHQDQLHDLQTDTSSRNCDSGPTLSARPAPRGQQETAPKVRTGSELLSGSGIKRSFSSKYVFCCGSRSSCFNDKDIKEVQFYSDKPWKSLILPEHSQKCPNGSFVEFIHLLNKSAWKHTFQLVWKWFFINKNFVFFYFLSSTCLFVFCQIKTNKHVNNKVFWVCFQSVEAHFVVVQKRAVVLGAGGGGGQHRPHLSRGPR